MENLNTKTTNTTTYRITIKTCNNDMQLLYQGCSRAAAILEYQRIFLIEKNKKHPLHTRISLYKNAIEIANFWCENHLMSQRFGSTYKNDMLSYDPLRKDIIKTIKL